ncbi:MAG: penicillin-binding protein 2 [Verrucomicrobium sp.]|nr:penicillin-binding protein 2 [Verrucomicrobium sp.]
MLFEPFSVPRSRFYVLAILCVAGTMTLLVRLWNVQVSHGQSYTDRLRDQTTVAVRLSPARGAILDRNGVPLAENRASFDIDFYLDELVRNYSQEHRGRLPRIEITRKTGKKTTVRREVDICKIVRNYLEPISRSLGFPIQLDEAALRRHYAQSPTVPFPYKTDLNFTTLSQFSERNLGVPGIQIAVRPVRHYDYGAFASHILGYVGDVEEVDGTPQDGQPESVGKHGVEKVYDAQLQGQPGGRILQINYRGYIEKEEGFTPPVMGKSLNLTLDARVQYIVEQALRRQGRAAAVVMDPWTGDILAMASVPSFDPNDFIPRITTEKWKTLRNDPTTPLLNRAVSAYAPGSTFKVLVSMAALEKGTITPNTVLFCPAVYVVDGHPFHDDVDYDRGNITLHDALRVSCDTYFYQVGIRTGIDQIHDVAIGQAGLGEPTGFPLPEDKGLIPDPAWLKATYPKERWTQAYTANVSIGQGAVLASPLQMASFMCAVANGGTLYYPRLIKGVTDGDGAEVISVPTRVHHMLDVRPSDLAAIRQGLVEVVKAGTATTVQLPDVTVAGKTGTAQFNQRLNGSLVKDLRTWFYCYAPFEQPRYVVCVMVEGGVAGGVTAGPIVHDILQALFTMDKTGKAPTLTYLTPAIGNFSGVSQYR